MADATMKLALLALCVFLTSRAPATPIPANSLVEPVPASTSPDKKYCLIEIWIGDTSASHLEFATADHKEILGFAPLPEANSSEVPYKKRSTMVWSPDSTRLALHDSLSKHSTVYICRLAQGRFEPVKVPDLLAAACERWKVPREQVKSSGQKPESWAGDFLTITVSATLKDGSRRNAKFQIRSPLEGATTLEK